jgi:hypothetical protein
MSNIIDMEEERWRRDMRAAMLRVWDLMGEATQKGPKLRLVKFQDKPATIVHLPQKET